MHGASGRPRHRWGAAVAVGCVGWSQVERRACKPVVRGCLNAHGHCKCLLLTVHLTFGACWPPCCCMCVCSALYMCPAPTTDGGPDMPAADKGWGSGAAGCAGSSSRAATAGGCCLAHGPLAGAVCGRAVEVHEVKAEVAVFERGRRLASRHVFELCCRGCWRTHVWICAGLRAGLVATCDTVRLCVGVPGWRACGRGGRL